MGRMVKIIPGMNIRVWIHDAVIICNYLQKDFWFYPISE